MGIYVSDDQGSRQNLQGLKTDRRTPLTADVASVRHRQVLVHSVSPSSRTDGEGLFHHLCDTVDRTVAEGAKLSCRRMMLVITQSVRMTDARKHQGDVYSLCGLWVVPHDAAA